MIIGLTGGIGSGKTAASDQFASHGISIVDSDIIAREVVEPGQPALASIAEHFGESILQQDGTLNRTALRHIVFQQAEEKQWLESLLHPLIGELTQQQLQNAESPYVIYASPLLVESGQTAICDEVIVVDVPEALQLERTAQRDHQTAEQVQAIMKSQATREQRLAQATHVIHNSGTLEALQQQVDELHALFMSTLAAS